MDTNFAGMNKSFCRNASGAILVGDINEIDSIEATAKWKNQVEEIVAQNDSPIPMVLAVNKVDTIADKEARGLPIENHQSKEWVDDFALSNNFIGALRVSAKDDTNIANLFSMLVRQMLIKEITEQQESQNEEQEGAANNDRIRLGSITGNN